MEKSLKILAIVLSILLVISIVTITVLSTLLIYSNVDNDIDFNIPNKTNKTYNLSNVNFKSTSDTASNNIQSVNVIANVKPFNATDKSLSWSLSWKDPNSDWATGKTVTDYVSVSVDSANSLHATITKLKSFSEIIILTVTSVSNPEVSKSVEIRCIGETDFKVILKWGDKEYIFNKNEFLDSGGSDINTELIISRNNNRDEEINVRVFELNAYESTNDTKPFVTFNSSFTKTVSTGLTTSFSVNYYFNYIDNIHLKVPIVNNESAEKTAKVTSHKDKPADNKFYQGIRDDYGDTEINITSFKHLIEDFCRQAFIDQGTNFLDFKFMGTGTMLRIHIC